MKVAPTGESSDTVDVTLRPIKLRLGSEDVYLVPSRSLEQWGGFLNGRRGTHQLVTPDNVAEIRHALLVPRGEDTGRVFAELTKQLEDGSALFFEVPPEPLTWKAPDETDIWDLIPDDGDDTRGDRPGPDAGVHWIEIVCVSAHGGSYAGAKARVRLPDGRTEFVTLDARSSVRFDDITEGGTAHFELSGDAVARGEGEAPVGQRYALGASIGLVTRRQHVLVVHPNPRAFVSVALFVDDDPVEQGQYTLTTALGDTAGALAGETVRVDGFALPSTASYAFEGVILPPRTEVDPDPTDGPDGPVDPNGPDGPVDPNGPDPKPDRPDELLEQQLRIRLVGAERLAVLVSFEGGRIETVTDADGLLDVELPGGVAQAQLLLPARGETYALHLGPLEPASTLRGASSRLHNLGLFAGQPTDKLSPALRDALRTFQQTYGLPITGELDPSTAQALESAHGC